jgi:Ca2+-binding RTX toxin-like protein
LTTSDNFVVAQGAALRFHNETGIVLESGIGGARDILRVEGTVEVAYDVAGAAIGVLGKELSGSPDAVVTVGMMGTIKVVSTFAGEAGVAVGFQALAADSPELQNRGVIDVSAVGRVTGVSASAQDAWLLTNSGTILASSAAANAFGVSLGTAGTLLNTGSITATGKTGAVGISITSLQSVGFNNTGIIIARDGGEDASSDGVLWRIQAAPQDQPASNSFRNSGRIEGDYALRVIDDAPAGHPPDLYANAGVLVGKVDLGAGASRLENTGRIEGEVTLGAGADTYVGAGGTAVGMVAGGDGADSLSGGAGFDNFQGNTGADTEAGGAGDDWVVGGKDNDSLSGDAGGDLVYGNIGADTCEGGEGNDIVRGGQDNDVIFGGAGDDYVSGDKGDDTVTGGAGADLFHTFGDAGVDRVLDFSLAQGDRVQLDPGTQYTVAQSGADTVISMTGGGQMILVGVQMSTLTAGWIFGA